MHDIILFIMWFFVAYKFGYWRGHADGYDKAANSQLVRNRGR